MKILLITPCIEKYLLKPGKKSKEVKLFRFSMLSVLTVAACTPKEHEVEIVDEHIEAVDFDNDADVIGISFIWQRSSGEEAKPWSSADFTRPS